MAIRWILHYPGWYESKFLLKRKQPGWTSTFSDEILFEHLRHATSKWGPLKISDSQKKRNIMIVALLREDVSDYMGKIVNIKLRKVPDL